ncbi:MAG: aminotransferase class I/II-fold pyridoxal phosphate-dependent enzyme [Clostridia bacterium]|nr:aminotransferase class I/II-fold pyridoxal phosphate-dependent enzyme [Clostridia bacterium]
MISFESDYTTGAHPNVLRHLIETNLEPLSGYGTDPYCENARRKIREACECPDADVHFLVGGTQTNSTVIAALLRDYEGVVAAKTGHVSLHEAGAVEYTGHKVLELPQENGKIQADVLADSLRGFYGDEAYEHMVFPGMVYISHPTEYGTLYTKAELTALAEVCRQYELPLFLDGARLGYGLMSYQTDLTLPDIARLCDVFYIGGTKVGALCGEAVVFTKNNAPRHFFTITKQHGALLAKGRLLGVQFDALFTDNLYFDIGRHAIDMSEKLKRMFAEKGYEFFMDSPTNQQFVILTNEKYEELKKHIVMTWWEPYGEDRSVVRFAASWSTTDDDLAALEKLL